MAYSKQVFIAGMNNTAVISETFASSFEKKFNSDKDNMTASTDTTLFDFDNHDNEDDFT